MGKICKPASVLVPRLMKVESFATVHQLVTTVEGLLNDDVDVISAVKHVFPPGSMTGAPKLRSVRILADLEQTPRGLYSGILGYISLHNAVDFNVVIRTAIFHKNSSLFLI